MRTEALAFWVREPGAGEIRPVQWLRRRLREAVEQRRDTLFGWSATAERMSRVLAELV